MRARTHSWLLPLAISAATLSGCGKGEAAQCPNPWASAMDVPINVAPGVYEVEVEMDGVKASAWWATHVKSGDLVQEAWAMVGTDRWFWLTTTGNIRVTECWAGGNPAHGCTELGPPRSGTLVLRHDGAEVMRLALARPVAQTLIVPSCPTVHIARGS